MANKQLVLSVHQLVDFLLRTGDIDNRVFNRSTMTEGSRIHSDYQSKQEEGSYISEYPLTQTFNVDEVEVVLQGRADGIINGRDRYIIDEIKTTVIDLVEFRNEQLEWHLGQAKCYALMFATERNLEDIGVRLTYIRQGKEKEKFIDDYVFTRAQLFEYVLSLIEDYLEFYNLIFRNLSKRRQSIEKLPFPFDSYRQGQQKLTKTSYANAIKGGNFFVEAPTGIGKTMSTLFPYVKAMKDDDRAKIFYLTAKSSGKEAAMNAVAVMREKGLELNNILITAKKKICFCDEQKCNPEDCPYARGYYNKIQGVLKYALSTENEFTYSKIIELARDSMVCPFEFQLDLSLFCDVIVCDYNYMYDPMAYLHRYFDTDASHYLALVDEAHNLIDRAREMYSASLNEETVLNAKKSIRKIKNPKLKRVINKVAKLFDDLNMLEEGDSIVTNFTQEQYRVLENAFTNLQDINKEEPKDITTETTNLLLEINSFLKISEFFSDNYLSYLHVEKGKTSMRLFCLDASRYIREIGKTIKATTFFSATMSPMEYYIDTLGGNKETDPYMILPSPFPKKNLKLMVAPKVSIKYKNRESSYEEVVKYIQSFISGRVGNYFIYSPSYEYMNKILSMMKFDDSVDVYVQEKDMTDYNKIKFLNNFKSDPERTTLGFLVIGGAFSEGIDLVSDRLIGAVVIGVGIAKLNFESDQIMEYYKIHGLPGYEYAYLNPGMNKVMQAVGRVIRSEKDRGVVLLIDERYTYRSYMSLFKEEWSNYEVVYSSEEVKKEVTNFFKK